MQQNENHSSRQSRPLQAAAPKAALLWKAFWPASVTLNLVSCAGDGGFLRGRGLSFCLASTPQDSCSSNHTARTFKGTCYFISVGENIGTDRKELSYGCIVSCSPPSV